MQFLIIAVILAQTTYSGNSEAVRYSQRALYEYPEVKIAIGNTEKLVYKNLGITPEEARYLLTIAPIIEGKISTKRIKNMGYRGNFNLRPDIEYSIHSGETRSVVNFDLSF